MNLYQRSKETIKRVEDMHKEYRHAMQGVKPLVMLVMPPARIPVATLDSFRSASRVMPTA